jgi:hypothetical protein
MKIWGSKKSRLYLTKSKKGINHMPQICLIEISSLELNYRNPRFAGTTEHLKNESDIIETLIEQNKTKYFNTIRSFSKGYDGTTFILSKIGKQLLLEDGNRRLSV